jgi:hypothetical protein
MAPEIGLERQRKAEYVFSAHVEQALAHIRTRKRTEVADTAD